MSFWSRFFGEMSEETQYRPDPERKKFRMHSADSSQEEELLREGGQFETEFEETIERSIELEVEKLNISPAVGEDMTSATDNVELTEVNEKIANMLGGIVTFMGFIFVIFFLPVFGMGYLVFPAVIILIILSAIFSKKKRYAWKRSWRK